MAKTIEAILARPDFIQIVADSISSSISGYGRTPTAPAAKPASGIKLESAGMEEVKKQIDVGAFIRFESSAFFMEIFVGFPEDLFLNYHELIFNARPEEIGPENQDLAGEFLNVAFGSVDPKTRDGNLKFRSSFPHSMAGTELAKFLKNLPPACVSVPLKSGHKEIFIWIFPDKSLRHAWDYTLKPT